MQQEAGKSEVCPSVCPSFSDCLAAEAGQSNTSVLGRKQPQFEMERIVFPLVVLGMDPRASYMVGMLHKRPSHIQGTLQTV